MNEQKLFSGMSEKFNLFLPYLLLLIFVAGIAFDFVHYASYFWPRLIVDIIFLNVVHQAFTIGIIVSFPEMENWLNFHRDLKQSLLSVKLVLIIAVIGSMTYFSFDRINHPLFLVVFFLIMIIFPTHHAISQSIGLSYFYNKEENKDLSVWERRLATVFLWSVCFALSVVVLHRNHLSGLTRSQYLLIRNGLVAFSVAVLVGKFLLFMKWPKHNRYKKLHFSVRYLLWPLSVFFPLATAGTKIIHGLEYAMVTHQMAKNSKNKRFKAPILVLCLTVAYLCYFRETATTNFLSGTDVSPWIRILASLSVAIAFIHYYLDRQLFRMRHAVNRENVRPLLSTSVKIQEH